MKPITGAVMIMLGGLAFFLCKETIRELSGIGVSSGPPPKYEVGSPEFWRHELRYYWFVRPFLPARCDITKTPTHGPGASSISEIKMNYWKRNISSSQYLQIAHYYACGLMGAGLAVLAGWLKKRMKTQNKGLLRTGDPRTARQSAEP